MSSAESFPGFWLVAEFGICESNANCCSALSLAFVAFVNLFFAVARSPFIFAVANLIASFLSFAAFRLSVSTFFESLGGCCELAPTAAGSPSVHETEGD